MERRRGEVKIYQVISKRDKALENPLLIKHNTSGIFLVAHCLKREYNGTVYHSVGYAKVQTTMSIKRLLFATKENRSDKAADKLQQGRQADFT